MMVSKGVGGAVILFQDTPDRSSASCPLCMCVCVCERERERVRESERGVLLLSRASAVLPTRGCGGEQNEPPLKGIERVDTSPLPF